MFINTLIALAILFAALAAFIATRPSVFRISRSAVLAASPDEVFGQVNDFHKWDAWSPWARLDPECKNTFEGAPHGTGAILKWSGNQRVGEGRQKIIASRPGELIRIKLQFVRPFAATNEAEFDFESEENGTRVTWTMSGKNNFVGKALSLVMDCEKIVGPQFEQGLANLRGVVEAASKRATSRRLMAAHS